MMTDCDLHRAVGRIEGKVDAILDKLEETDARHEKAEKRIGSIERKVHWYSGAAAVVAAALGYVMKGS